MRYRFWSFVHDQLKAAWHWVYYHKLKPLEPKIPGVNAPGGYHYTFTYLCGKTAMTTLPSPEIKFWRDEDP